MTCLILARYFIIIVIEGAVLVGVWTNPAPEWLQSAAILYGGGWGKRLLFGAIYLA
jgi:hypothetical protein